MGEDKLHKSYIWHIVTLAKMKWKLREIKKRRISYESV